MLEISNCPLARHGLNLQAESLIRFPPGQSEIPDMAFKVLHVHYKSINQRTNGPVNAHLISWPSKAQNKQNQEKYMVKK